MGVWTEALAGPVNEQAMAAWAMVLELMGQDREEDVGDDGPFGRVK
jgi:hypothetical protein